MAGRRSAHLLYNAALVALSPALAIYLARRLARGKSREGWSERWGKLPAGLARGDRPRIWVHGASVGEFMAAQPIIKELRERLPDYEILFSCITPGGHESARAHLGKLVDGLFYAPFDVPLAVRRVVSTVRPDVLVVVETEIWPNLLHYVAASGARLALVNARISDRSFEPYRKLRRVMGPALQRFDRILARTATDAERLQAIGAPAERLEVAGNVKFDQAGGCMEAGERLALRSDLGLPAGSPVFVVGSTREAAEEDIVLAAYLKAREQVPELALIYAPRHIERASELAQKMALAGLHPVRRTQAGTSALPLRQLILDTYGELGRVYAVADVAFLGNSLTPPGGGQNLVQPLAQGVPVLFGPYVQNFRDVAELARAEAVGFRVEDAGSLASQVVRLVQDATTRAKIGERAVRLVESNRGVAARCAEAICELAVNGRK